MQLPDLKQLDRLIALCRKRGVKSVQIDNIKLELGDEPYRERQSKKSKTVTEFNYPDEEMLTEDQLLNWSVTNLPSESQPPSE